MVEGIIDSKENRGLIKEFEAQGRELVKFPRMSFSYSKDDLDQIEKLRTPRWILVAEPFDLESVLGVLVQIVNFDDVVVIAGSERMVNALREHFIHTDLVLEEGEKFADQLHAYDDSLNVEEGLILGHLEELQEGVPTFRAETTSSQMSVAKWWALKDSIDVFHFCSIDDRFVAQRLGIKRSLPSISHGSDEV